jgi:predicted signal transduction protein with EAL and GGDEF domain
LFQQLTWGSSYQDQSITPWAAPNYAAKGIPIPVQTNTELSQLTLNALASEEEVIAAFAPLKNALWGLLVIGGLVGVFAGRKLSSSHSEPIEKLVHAFNVMQRGQLPSLVSSNRQDEIGILERAFDQMASSIQTSRERLTKMLDIDPLTELLNYRSFRKALEQTLEQNEGKGVWIGLIDIDQFESFNQTHSSEEGDLQHC